MESKYKCKHCGITTEFKQLGKSFFNTETGKMMFTGICRYCGLKSQVVQFDQPDIIRLKNGYFVPRSVK